MDSLKKNKNNIKKEYVKIYQDKIFPLLKAFEVQRKNLKKTSDTKVAVCFLLLIISILLLIKIILNFTIHPFLLCFFLIISFVTLFLLFAECFLYPQIEKDLIMKMKANCFANILKAFGNIYWTNDKKVIDDFELSASGLFVDYTDRTTDDEFYGEYNGVGFAVSEIQLFKKQYVGRNSDTLIPVFKGVVLQFFCKNHTNKRTIVATKTDLTEKSNVWFLPLLSFLGFAQPILTSLCKNDYSSALFFIGLALVVSLGGMLLRAFSCSKEDKLDKVVLEDWEFNNDYNVYSTDQIQARYHLTPAFMEKFKNLQTVFGSKNARCAFYDDKIMFAIKTNKNLFEVCATGKSFENPAIFSNLFNEINVIYEIIDYFKLGK